MSPILVRPVREQLEHDRVIRLLQVKYKKKFEALINPGHEQTAPVLVGTSPWYPDVVLYSQERGRKLMGTVEVETAESVNNLEAMSQWRTFGQLKAAFHLYVPASSIDTARRMATELQVNVAELWVYSLIGDQMRFTLVQRSAAGEAKARAVAASEARTRAEAQAARPQSKAATAPAGGASRSKVKPEAQATAKAVTKTAAKPAVKVKAKPVAKAKAATKAKPKVAAKARPKVAPKAKVTTKPKAAVASRSDSKKKPASRGHKRK